MARYVTNKLNAGCLGTSEQQTVSHALHDALQLLRSALHDSASGSGSTLQGGGLYVGTGGVALAFFRVAAMRSNWNARQAPAGTTDDSEGGGGSCNGSGNGGNGKSGGGLLRWLCAEGPTAVHIDEAVAAAEQSVHAFTSRPQAGRVTFLEGAAGVFTLRAVLAARQGDHHKAQACAQAVADVYAREVCRLAPQECELLYGRAGYLYCLLVLYRHVGPQYADAATIKALAAAILLDGLHGAQMLHGHGDAWPLMYAWHNKHYLGAIHGVAGIVMVLLQAHIVLGDPAWPKQEHMNVLHRVVHMLVGSCFPSGNLPSSLGNTTDRLVQLCHGAPGLLLLLSQYLQLPGVAADPALLAAVSAVGEAVWSRGLLTKGVGLCHGVSGNAYALLAAANALHTHAQPQPYTPTGGPSAHRDSIELTVQDRSCSRGGEQAEMLSLADMLRMRGVRMALYAAEHWQELYDVPDRPDSLFEGLAGAVCLWADLLEDPTGATASLPGIQLLKL